ncbi:MAG: glycosyltransferase family 39 protein [Deltaproteobacteria bacterium]|nr:glycosyltransferase family 39 protein [Deltaproteobacteria bacterium]
MKLAWPKALPRPPFAALGPAWLAGALLGLKSQLYFLGWDGWQNAWLRLPGGLVAGALAGGLLAWGLARLWARREAGTAVCAWSLLGLAPLAWLAWETFSGHPLLWLLPAVLLALMLSLPLALWATGWALAALTPAWLLLWGALGPGQPIWLLPTAALAALYFLALARRLALEPEASRPVMPWAGVALAGILALGLGLRLTGVAHGWPEFISHVDTPKQFVQLSAFLRGDLAPPMSYPLGHVYLYAALGRLSAWLFAPGSPWHLWAVGHEGWNAYVLFARFLQAGLGALVPLLGFLTARRLWGRGAGLLAGLLLALDPLQLTYSRQLMGDVPQCLAVWLAFLFTVRVLQTGRWWDYLLAGLAAGAAVAAKVYGGYVILLALAAWGIRRPWGGWTPLITLLTGLIMGCLLFSPLFWVNPARWAQDLINIVHIQSPAVQSNDPMLALAYAWEALVRRFGLAWMLLVGAGLAFVALRHKKADLLALLGALLAIAIIVIRLRSLREWDLVNLTPLLSLPLAAMLAAAIQAAKAGKYRRPVLCLLCIFLLWQGLLAMGDAWLARMPDTGQMAGHWVSKVLGPEQLMAGEYPVSKGRWLPPPIYQRSHKWLLRQDLAKQGRPALAAQGVLALERFWWQQPVPRAWLRPAQIFASRNYYWENPNIGLYLPTMPDYNSQVILPHVRVNLPLPAYLTTAWARSQPRDLLVGRRFARSLGFKQDQWLLSPQAPGAVTFAALGRGRARLFWASELGLPLDLDWGRTVSGEVHPWRRLVPVRPRVYKLEGRPHPEGAFVWVGLYPRPGIALPLLMRQGKWKAMAKLASRLGPDAPAEARLIAAAALLEAGDRQGAERALSKLNQDHPNFLTTYWELAQAGTATALQRALASLSGMPPALLQWERVEWPPSPKRDSAGLGWPPARVESAPGGTRLRLSQLFLPGLVRLTMELDTPLSASGKLTVRSTGWDHAATLAELPLKAGQALVELSFQVNHGPVFLELELGAPDNRPIWLSIEPDLGAEFAWRWGVLAPRLDSLAAWRGPQE